MANPNRTVAEWTRRHPRHVKHTPDRNATPFSDWLVAQARAGVVYQTLEEANAAFAQEGGK